MKKSLVLWISVFLIGLNGGACGENAKTTPSNGSKAISAVFGTWIPTVTSVTYGMRLETRLLIEPNAVRMTVQCESMGEMLKSEAKSSAKITDTEIDIASSAQDSRNGEKITCSASLEKEITTFTVSGNILSLLNQKGVFTFLRDSSGPSQTLSLGRCEYTNPAGLLCSESNYRGAQKQLALSTSYENCRNANNPSKNVSAKFILGEKCDRAQAVGFCEKDMKLPNFQTFFVLNMLHFTEQSAKELCDSHLGSFSRFAPLTPK